MSLPAGARVLFAGLYYGGKLTAGTGGSPAPNPCPTTRSCSRRRATRAIATLTAPHRSTTSSTQYQGFVNVTGDRRRGRAPGTYWTANVQLGTGLSDSQLRRLGARRRLRGPGRAEPQPVGVRRNAERQQRRTVTIPLSGFQTPLSGPVTSTVGIVAYEGDLGTTGDVAQLQGPSGAFTALSNAVNPGPPATSASNSNVFNSTISNAGAFVTSRTPSFQNNLGYDADLFSTTSVLGNGQTSTQVQAVDQRRRLSAGRGDDRHRPVRAQDRRDEDRRSRHGEPRGHADVHGERCRTPGQDGATGTTFSDPIPAGAVFVPGSIRLNGAVVTDASGDDLGEFAGGRVVVRLGTGATPAAGGLLAPGASATVSFQVTVATAGWRSGATIENTAELAFQRRDDRGSQHGRRRHRPSRSVLVPDLAIGKTHAPDAGARAAQHVHDHGRQRR